MWEDQECVGAKKKASGYCRREKPRVGDSVDLPRPREDPLDEVEDFLEEPTGERGEGV